MPAAEGRNAKLAQVRPDSRQHLFHGAHAPGKLRGAIELRAHPDTREIEPGYPIVVKVQAFNHKAGHKIPSGSAEERQLWLTVTATDAAGREYHLPVDAKGFEGEEFNISSSTALAYQDIGDILGIDGFEGLARDAIPHDGDRIFRLPYFDPQGRMTIAQWNTAAFATDYRLAPLEARSETFTWTLPDRIAVGPVTVTATIYYSRLVSSVATYLNVPEEEWRPVTINAHTTSFEVFD